jgi:hypothetical protein
LTLQALIECGVYVPAADEFVLHANLSLPRDEMISMFEHINVRASNNLVAVPSNTVVDLMASYQFDTWLRKARVQVNLRNIFDERTYESGNSNSRGFTSVFPELPRMLSVGLMVSLL